MSMVLLSHFILKFDFENLSNVKFETDILQSLHKGEMITKPRPIHLHSFPVFLCISIKTSVLFY